MKPIIALSLFCVFCLAAFGALLVWGRRADSNELQRLVDLQPSAPRIFSAELIANLPEPARRYFPFYLAEVTEIRFPQVAR